MFRTLTDRINPDSSLLTMTVLNRKINQKDHQEITRKILENGVDIRSISDFVPHWVDREDSLIIV
jgi:ADP-dependent phosphofructokinase/glucokinase